ncbi:hypothetical protein RCL_jg16030.t1 [Rhizophagus clarus]|uniref:Uncharacterized protein n=1 Tax=Rhizophagus clarus TaxID=94130 RepID=A0A8H3L823_9GLOM|nr:hypothetical protein RCL_jg16030.t1 [Rhizophagus clarus]
MKNTIFHRFSCKTDERQRTIYCLSYQVEKEEEYDPDIYDNIDDILVYFLMSLLSKFHILRRPPLLKYNFCTYCGN